MKFNFHFEIGSLNKNQKIFFLNLSFFKVIFILIRKFFAFLFLTVILKPILNNAQDNKQIIIFFKKLERF